MEMSENTEKANFGIHPKADIKSQSKENISNFSESSNSSKNSNKTLESNEMTSHFNKFKNDSGNSTSAESNMQELQLKQEFKEFFLNFLSYFKSGLKQTKNILLYPAKSLKSDSLLEFKNILQIYLSSMILYSVLFSLVSMVSQNYVDNFLSLASSSVYLFGYDFLMFVVMTASIYFLEPTKNSEPEIPYLPILRNLIISSVISGAVLLLLSTVYFMIISPILVKTSSAAISNMNSMDLNTKLNELEAFTKIQSDLFSSTKLGLISLVSKLFLSFIVLTPYLIKAFFIYLFFRTETELLKKHSQIISGVVFGFGLIQALSVLF